MEAARTSETSVDNYFTRQYIPKTNLDFILAAVRTWNLTLSVNVGKGERGTLANGYCFLGRRL